MIESVLTAHPQRSWPSQKEKTGIPELFFRALRFRNAACKFYTCLCKSYIRRAFTAPRYRPKSNQIR